MINLGVTANANQCPSGRFGHWSTQKPCRRSKRRPCTQLSGRLIKHGMNCFGPKPSGGPSPVLCIAGLMP